MSEITGTLTVVSRGDGTVIQQECPLCSHGTATVISTTRFADIWEAFQRNLGAVFSERTIQAHTPAAFTSLVECQHCGLQHFTPAVPGDAQFYLELTSSVPTYYNVDKWEFSYVRSLLQPTDTLLDVGCGTGAFVRSASEIAALAVGADTNPVLAESAARANCQIINCAVDQLAARYRDSFDYVTAFQVLEHIEAVIPFAEAAFACVKPGGFFVVSVPNRYRRRAPGFEVLDHPPHHMTRWSEQQFGALAQQLGGSAPTIVKEPLNSSQIIGALRERELEAIVPKWLVGRVTIVKIVSRVALLPPFSFFWRSLSLTERLSMWGMSMIAFIQKPSGSSSARAVS